MKVVRFAILMVGCLTLLVMTTAIGTEGPVGQSVQMQVTAYCDCGKCCGWERGSWKYLKLDLWNKYVSEGPNQGKKYTGRTASQTRPREADSPLLSLDSLFHPWRIPQRALRAPWILGFQEGTIAADTTYYPFGTRMHIPGYGWGIVEDRGSAIKGPNRIDLFMTSHRRALEWGVRTVQVEIQFPGKDVRR